VRARPKTLFATYTAGWRTLSKKKGPQLRGARNRKGRPFYGRRRVISIVPRLGSDRGNTLHVDDRTHDTVANPLRVQSLLKSPFPTVTHLMAGDRV